MAAVPEQPLSPTKIPLLSEKAVETPATQSSSDSPPPTPSPSHHGVKSNMEGALPSLLWGAFAPCVPVAVISSVLLTAILYNRIDNSYVYLPPKQVTTSTNEGLQALQNIQYIENNGGDSAYYLYYKTITNPAVLHMISSWTAKLIPFVTGASMALVAFFAGQRIMKATASKSEKLPSPHQVSILIGLLNGGGTQPLLDAVKYRWQNHESLVQPVPLAFWCLSFIVFMTFAIGAVDSWFGTVTTAMNIALVIPQNHTTFSFGRGLNSSQCGPGDWAVRSCPSNNQASCSYPCSITNWTAANGERQGVLNAQQAAEVLMSNSLNNTIYNVTVNGSNYYFLGDVKSNTKLDFTATTLAIKTQCQVITQDCNVTPNADNVSSSFTCGAYSAPSFSYSGEVGIDPKSATSAMDEAMVGIQFFNDTAKTQPVGFGSSTTDLFSTQNPLQFLAWSKGFPPVDTYGDEFINMRKDHYLKYDASGDTVFVISCSATIAQVKYKWTNATVSLVELEADEDVADYYGAVFSAPFAINSPLSHLALQDASALAAYQKTPEGLSKIFGDRFSQAAVALSSGIAIGVRNELEWTRQNNFLAVRVPYVPLYLLVTLKAIYALFALSLALLAVFLTQPSQAQEVKERLTVDGLAAGFFEPSANHERAVKDVCDLFEEHKSPEKSEDTKKIGLLQTDKGGWLWVAVAQKAAQGLGLQAAASYAADQVADVAAAQMGTVGTLGQGYQLVKDII
ncbi:uncharacterized protein Z520_00452 [Fonsecaea multimorphosa CBS 102226]|uniref:Uncharacterized protein n=1 Tax=Fonsecaea multimorphosa CBS 102226 TaxID=1442371 RepID=A0A0D2HPJ8_9EURO|nr:uncharacterized protein Z520_00452 [Fonsecaea multimorphosa CBS 102226]KIY03761.1 hypothetical protein Z520_00452 [Fonsecaea multimorphosa CBS 102226]OAL32454.1 hypothetical protein AYO22_00476 [Fonsecaea multimorphosa]